MSELFSVFGSAAKPPSQKQKKRVAKAGNCSLKNLQIQFDGVKKLQIKNMYCFSMQSNCSLKNLQIQFDGVKKLQIKSILLFDTNQNAFKK